MLIPYHATPHADTCAITQPLGGAVDGRLSLTSRAKSLMAEYRARFRISSRFSEPVPLSGANAHPVSTAMLSTVANPLSSEPPLPSTPASGKYITNRRVARQGLDASDAAERHHRSVHRGFVQDVEDTARCRKPLPRPSTITVPVRQSGTRATMMPDAVRRGLLSRTDTRYAVPPEPAQFSGPLHDIGEGRPAPPVVPPPHIPPYQPVCVPAPAPTKSAMTFIRDGVTLVSATITPIPTLSITTRHLSPTTLEFLAYNRSASGRLSRKQLVRRCLGPPHQSSPRPPASHTGFPAWVVTSRSTPSDDSGIADCRSCLPIYRNCRQ